MASVTSTLATDASVSATMKAVNMTDQQTPDTHTGQRAFNSPRQSATPRIALNAIVIATALKRLRQNVTSKLAVASKWRVTTPAMLHSKVTRIISATARRCGMVDL